MSDGRCRKQLSHNWNIILKLLKLRLELIDGKFKHLRRKQLSIQFLALMLEIIYDLEGEGGGDKFKIWNR